MLFDEFEGAAGHDLEVSFHFASVEATIRGNSVIAGADVAMHWAASYPLTPAIAKGREGPDEGWIAPSLGVRVAAPVVRLSGRMERHGAGLLTVLVPAQYRVSAIPSIGQRLALSVEGAEWCDEVVAVPPGVDAGPASAPGLSISRRRNETVIEQRSVGGGDLPAHGSPIQAPGSRTPDSDIAASSTAGDAAQAGR